MKMVNEDGDDDDDDATAAAASKQAASRLPLSLPLNPPLPMRHQTSSSCLLRLKRRGTDTSGEIMSPAKREFQKGRSELSGLSIRRRYGRDRRRLYCTMLLTASFRRRRARARG